MPKLRAKLREPAPAAIGVRYVCAPCPSFRVAPSSRSRLGVLLCGSVDRAGRIPLAIKGYDPVAYFTLQRATPGVAQYGYEWDEHRWQFANAQHRDLFKADPVRYAPQFENFCAVALARGEVREANPEYWLISRRQALSVRQVHRPGRSFARTSRPRSNARNTIARYCRRSSEPGSGASAYSPALRKPSRRSARSFGFRNLLPKLAASNIGSVRRMFSTTRAASAGRLACA